MSQVVDHLAELTGYRDRDVMDVTLVTALRELIEPRSVAIYRVIGEGDQQRWLTRACLKAGDAAASADPVWVAAESLPLLEDFPLRLQCLRSREHCHAAIDPAQGGGWTHVFPIATEHDVVGVIEVVCDTQMRGPSRRVVASILRIYHNFQGLLDYSERDTLTGLLNRKTFDVSFLKVLGEVSNAPPPPAVGEEERRHLVAQPHYVIGVIDIDHFKRVNDGFGHLIGDEVLLLLSRLMRSTFRFHDLLFRFGGEEFVVLMRCDEASHAAEAFERLRRNTEAYTFPQVGHITISVGFTEVRPGDTPTVAFERADKAVYHAKGNGRNQVHDHAALVRSGILQEAVQAESDVELF